MSGLEDLYREIILDHYRSPRNRGELPVPPAHRAEGFNPLCGDEIVVYIEVADGRLTDVRIGGQGCSISQSSASMMSAAVKGRSVEEARRLISSFKAMMSIHEQSIGGDGPSDGAAGEAPPDEADADAPSGLDASQALQSDGLGELAALQGVVKFPVRIKCATLSWNTLSQVLDEVSSATGS